MSFEILTSFSCLKPARGSSAWHRSTIKTTTGKAVKSVTNLSQKAMNPNLKIIWASTYHFWCHLSCLQKTKHHNYILRGRWSTGFELIQKHEELLRGGGAGRSGVNEETREEEEGWGQTSRKWVQEVFQKKKKKKKRKTFWVQTLRRSWRETSEDVDTESEGTQTRPRCISRRESPQNNTWLFFKLLLLLLKTNSLFVFWSSCGF